MAEFEDELDSVVPQKKAAVKPATKPAADELEEEVEEPKKHSAKASSDDFIEDMDASWDDEKLATKGDGLNRIRPEKGKAKRFAFIPFFSLKAGKSHFVDNKGKFRCLTPNDAAELSYCCEKLGKEGDLHFVGLAVEYTNADSKTGKYLEKGVPIEWEIGYVDLSRANFRSIRKLPEEEQTVNDIDIIMTHADRAFGYEFHKASKARWRQNPELVKEVEAACQKFIRDGGKKLIAKLGKKATPLEWKALLSGTAAASAEEASLDGLDDVE
jgi:hypothetical protein